MAVCGRCLLCGAKFDCGELTACRDCGGKDGRRRPGVVECNDGECPTSDELSGHLICAGCLRVMHALGGLSDAERAVFAHLHERAALPTRCTCGHDASDHYSASRTNPAGCRSCATCRGYAAVLPVRERPLPAGVTLATAPEPPAPLAMDKPWPIFDVVARLCAAADHLLSAHDCDCHGHEAVAAARDAGHAWLVEQATPRAEIRRPRVLRTKDIEDLIARLLRDPCPKCGAKTAKEYNVAGDLDIVCLRRGHSCDWRFPVDTGPLSTGRRVD